MFLGSCLAFLYDYPSWTASLIWNQPFSLQVALGHAIESQLEHKWTPFLSDKKSLGKVGGQIALYKILVVSFWNSVLHKRSSLPEEPGFRTRGQGCKAILSFANSFPMIFSSFAPASFLSFSWIRFWWQYLHQVLTVFNEPSAVPGRWGTLPSANCIEGRDSGRWY